MRRPSEPSDERLRALVEQAGGALRTFLSRALQGFFLLDSEHRILGLNRTASQMAQGLLGRELVIGDSLHEAAKAARLEAYEGRFQRALAGETHTYETFLTDRSGRPRWFESSYTPVLHEDGDVVGVFLSVLDISTRKETEEENRRLAALVQNSADFVGIATLDGQVRFVNAAGRAMVGLGPRDDVHSLRLTDFFAPEDTGWLEEEAYATVLGTGSWQGEVEVRHLRNGRRIPFWLYGFLIKDPETGQPVALGTVSRNITGRRAAEQALRESEARLHAAIENLPFEFWACDVDRRFVLQNSPSVERWGNALGKRPEDLDLDLRSREAWEQAWERAFGGEVVAGETSEGVGADGRLLYEVVAPIQADDEVLGLLGVRIDVTDRARLEERLRQAQKMETLGRLAGGIAHDFNNLLSPIVGYADLVISRLADDDPVRTDVEEIRAAAAKASGLTRQLLAFSRKQVLELSQVDLNREIADSEKILGRLVGDSIELSLALAPDLDPIRADLSQIQQVLLNFALNARDAMPDGGVLRIETQNVLLETANQPPWSEAEAGRYVLLRFADSGLGMEPETARQIFEPFFTTKEPGRGTGLGLSTVYGVVTQHGGFVRAESALGAGTVFSVLLPSGASARSPAEERASRPRRVGGETVLVVEDEAVVRTLTQRALEAQGYRVLTAGSYDESIELAAGHAGKIDLLLADTILQERNGKEVYEAIAARRPCIAVLFMSGYTHDVISQRGILAPGIELLQKPFHIRDLTQKVREVLDRARSEPGRRLS